MAVSVGPTLFAVIKYSIGNSYKAGIAFVLGVSVSDILYVSVANLAASVLIRLNSYATNIAFAGSAILFLVGLLGLVKKIKPKRPKTDVQIISGAQYLKIGAGGFIINTINPGVIVSWLTAVSATAAHSGSYRALLYTVCLVLILSIDFMKVFLAERIRLMLTPRRIIYTQRFSSAVIMVLGLLLFFSTLYKH